MILNLRYVFGAPAACVRAGGESQGLGFNHSTDIRSLQGRGAEVWQKMNISCLIKTLLIERTLGFIWIQCELITRVTGRVLKSNSVVWSRSCKSYVRRRCCMAFRW